MTSGQSPTVSIVIPNWNGAELLRRNLPSVQRAMAAYPQTTECIVVDDGSDDDSAAVVRAEFPWAQLVCRQTNSGFSATANEGIQAAHYPLVLLLNSDIEVEPDFIAPLAAHFEGDANLFAVAALQQTEGAGPPASDGFRTLVFRWGQLATGGATAEVLEGRPHPPLGFANGGCSLFSKEKVLAIGGFCELLDPFYWEDAELSIQAIKRGWTIEFEPRSRVLHRHGASTRQKPLLFKVVPFRNSFLTHWLTLDRTSFWLCHLLAIPMRLVTKLLRADFAYHAGFVLALLKIPAVIRERRLRKTNTLVPPRCQ